MEKIALVTGSTNNVGKGIAQGLSQDGFLVIVTSRHENEAKTVAPGSPGFVLPPPSPERDAALPAGVHGRGLAQRRAARRAAPDSQEPEADAARHGDPDDEPAGDTHAQDRRPANAGDDSVERQADEEQADGRHPLAPGELGSNACSLLRRQGASRLPAGVVATHRTTPAARIAADRAS